MLPPGAMPMPPTCAAERVGQVVAVEVRGRDDVELVGPGEHLLQRDVGDRVLDEDLVAGVAAAVVPADRDVGELVTGEVVAPAHERTLGELLDVALVHERDALAVALHRVLDRGADEALRAGLRDGLDADAGVGTDVPTERSCRSSMSFFASGVPSSTSRPA